MFIAGTQWRKQYDQYVELLWVHHYLKRMMERTENGRQSIRETEISDRRQKLRKLRGLWGKEKNSGQRQVISGWRNLETNGLIWLPGAGEWERSPPLSHRRIHSRLCVKQAPGKYDLFPTDTDFPRGKNIQHTPSPSRLMKTFVRHTFKEIRPAEVLILCSTPPHPRSSVICPF